MKKGIFWGIIILGYLLFNSCKKKVTDIIPVMEIEKDMSIPGALDIKYFSFPSLVFGYAASESDFIYKTIDGGVTWSKIDVSSGKTCTGLEFFNETEGMCLMNNDVYVTNDGGETWSIKGTGDFIGKTDDGLGVIGDCTSSSCFIRSTSDNGQTFVYKGKMSYDLSFTFRSSRIVDNKVIILSSDQYKHGNQNAFDLINNTPFSLELGDVRIEETLNDIYLYSNQGAAVGNYGAVLDEVLGFSRSYYGHIYPYYSVDGYGTFKVAVGEKTIVSNTDIGNGSEWNEVFDVNGNGFPYTFYKIRVITSYDFYVSGSNGLILKCKI